MSNRRHMLLALVGLAVMGPARAETPAPRSEVKRKAAGKPVAKKGTARKRPDPTLVITINKASQKMTVEVNGRTEYRWPVSTGARGYDTPSGTFRPFRLEKEHFSKEWDDAPMPHSIFFTAQGHAVHGSYHIKSLGRRASHGCVRLHPDNAAKLFALVERHGLGNTVVVINGGFFDFGGDRPERKKDGRKRFLFFGSLM